MRRAALTSTMGILSGRKALAMAAVGLAGACRCGAAVYVDVTAVGAGTGAIAGPAPAQQSGKLGLSLVTGVMLIMVGFLMITNLFVKLSGVLPQFGI